MTSISPVSNPGQATSSASGVAVTVYPSLSSRMLLTTATLASAPTHGLMAILTLPLAPVAAEPLGAAAVPVAVVGAALPPAGVLQAPRTRASTVTDVVSRTRRL